MEEAISVLEAMQSDGDLSEHIAVAYQLGGMLLLSLGDMDKAIDWFWEAGARFEQAGGDSEQFGTFLHDFAVMLHDLGVPDLPLQYARRAKQVLAPFGGHSRVDVFIARLNERAGEADASSIDDYRTALRTSRRGARADAAQALALRLLDEQLGPAEVAELHAALKTAFDEVWRDRRSREVQHLVVVLTTMIDLHWEGIPLPAWLPKALERALAVARQVERLDHEADLLTVRAVWLLHCGDRAGGLDAALTAVARHDEYALATETSMVRLLTGRVNEYARLVAVQVATERGDAHLAAELIESARLQVEPRPAEAVTGPLDAPYIVSRIGCLTPVSVGGRSRLAPYYAARAEPIPLERAIEAVGGEGAAWWGAWASNERIQWALLLDGAWSCGTLSISEGSELRPLLHDAWSTGMDSGEDGVAHILAGPWCRNAFSEEMLATDLGEALIPPQLKRAIAEADPARPISLVLGGNLFAMLPVPALGVTLGAAQPVRRLLEVAVPRLAPPVILTERVLRRECVAGDLHPVGVACVDPCDDLRNAGNAPGGATTILSGRDDGHRRATRANLDAALRELRASAPGIFYYSGHAAASGDSEDALVLADGDTLSAQEIFDADAPLFPARTVLSACSSSGAHGAGAGEWLGLTAAILWQGSRQVVATNWKIWDTPFTSSFDASVVEALRTAPDVAAALRARQLDALARWRASDHDLTDWAQDGMPARAEDVPFPLIWGAYACIGVRV